MAENDRIPAPVQVQSPIVVTVDDVLLLMEQMHAHRIAFVEMPGVLRVGTLPDGKQQSQATRTEQQAPVATTEEALRRVAMAKAAQAKRREDAMVGSRARSILKRQGGIQGQQAGSLDSLADDLAKEAGAPIAAARRPPVGGFATIPNETEQPDTGDDQTPIE